MRHLSQTILPILLVGLVAVHGAIAKSKLSVTTFSPQDKLHFIPNQGQWDSHALYQTRGSNHTTWFASDGAYHQFIRQIDDSCRSGLSKANNPTMATPKNITRQADVGFQGNADLQDKTESYVLKQRFLDANPNPIVRPENKQTFYCNYFLGNDSTKWRPNVPTFNSIVYTGVYPDVDVRYFGDGEHLNYDFILAPGADLSQVRVRYEGADSLWIDESGELVVETQVGQLKEQKLVVYQGLQSETTAIPARYVLFDKTTYGFELLDQPNPFLAVVVDPTLIFSTFLGGSAVDIANGIAIDESGSAYLTGETSSSDFPMQGAYDNTLTGAFDVFVTKLSASGNSLIFSTYLGGSSFNNGTSIALDGLGNVYVTGETSSSNFPTFFAFQIGFNGGADAFVTKLSPAGNSLLYSTYLGGTSIDHAQSIAVDGSRHAYVTGYTASSNFPRQNPYDNSFNGGTDDAFVTKLTVNGDSLAYSTFLGGSNDDIANGIAVDGSGNAYVTGSTLSSDFPKQDAYDNTLNATDAFITKFSTDGISLVYSTYVGGSNVDVANGIAVDTAGQPYIAGYTQSADFPMAHTFDNILDGGTDAFIAKLTSNGSSLDYGTFYGGSSTDYANAIAVDAQENAFITGRTTSTDFLPWPSGAFDETFNGGNYDAFITKLPTNTGHIQYSSFLGGSGDDIGYGIAVTPAGKAFVTGSTTSSDFPTLSAYDNSQNVGLDAFVARFDIGDKDGDDIVDQFDNCPSIPNPMQHDVDEDGFGNECDPSFSVSTVEATDDIFFLAKGDFDRDNYVDYVTSGFASATDGRIAITYGSPNTLVESPPVTLLDVTNAALDVDYVNADTLLDIIARTTSKIYVFRNLGNRSFAVDSIALITPPSVTQGVPMTSYRLAEPGELQTEAMSLNIGDQPYAPYLLRIINDAAIPGDPPPVTDKSMPPSGAFITTGYFNADAQLDMFVSLNNLLLGNGTGGFTASTIPFALTQCDAADMNGDGYDDLVGTITELNTSGILTNVGAGSSFTPSGVTSLSSHSFSYSNCKAGFDINQDGNSDYVTVTGTIGSTTDTGEIKLVLGDGAGDIASTATFVLNGQGSFFTVDAVDFDGDGDLDLSTVDADGHRLIVILNDNGDFFEIVVINLGAGTQQRYAITGEDLDRNGSTDYLIGGESGAPVVVALNQLGAQGDVESDEMTVTALNNFGIRVTNPFGATISPTQQTVAGAEYRSVDFDNDDTLDARTFDYNLFKGEYRITFDPNAGPAPTGGKLSATIGIDGSQQARIFKNYDVSTKDALSADSITFFYTVDLGIEPENGIQTETNHPTFGWNAVFDSNEVQKYQFQLDKYYDLRSPRFSDSSLTSPFYTPPSALGFDSIFYWRVRAQTADIWSGWSRTFAAYIGPGCCIGIRGDANGNGSLNVLDLNYLVAYFFSGGPVPPCLQEADVNGNGSVNVLDLNALVAYFFSGGPTPAACP